MTALWLGIFGSLASQHQQAAFQRTWEPFIKPVHILRPKASQPAIQRATAKEVTVAGGQTLWSVASKYCGNGNDYRNIMKANGIKSWTIRPGEKIRVSC